MKKGKRRILITGASGFLGCHLVRGLGPDFDVAGTYLSHRRGLPSCEALPMDITDAARVREVLKYITCDVLIHTAALSDPGRCEKDRDAAFRTNVTGTENLIDAARKEPPLLIYISTDLVFDGERGSYLETDTPRPGNYYAETKLQAEEIVRGRSKRWLVLRPSLMYGWGAGVSHSFMDWLYGNLRAGKEAGLFRDQFRSFLYVEDVARCIRSLLKAGVENRVVHAPGPERLSRYLFGKKLVPVFGFPDSLLRPIRMEDLPGYAHRGRDCSLRSEVFTEIGFRPQTVMQGLREMKKSANRVRAGLRREWDTQGITGRDDKEERGAGRKLPQVACAVCGKPADWYDNPFRPFCSERCKILDLGAWADEQYRIPGESLPSEGREPDRPDEEEKT